MASPELKHWLQQHFVDDFTSSLEDLGVRTLSDVRFLTDKHLVRIAMPPIHRARVLAAARDAFGSPPSNPPGVPSGVNRAAAVPAPASSPVPAPLTRAFLQTLPVPPCATTHRAMSAVIPLPPTELWRLSELLGLDLPRAGERTAASAAPALAAIAGVLTNLDGSILVERVCRRLRYRVHDGNEQTVNSTGSRADVVARVLAWVLRFAEGALTDACFATEGGKGDKERRSSLADMASADAVKTSGGGVGRGGSDGGMEKVDVAHDGRQEADVAGPVNGADEPDGNGMEEVADAAAPVVDSQESQRDQPSSRVRHPSAAPFLNLNSDRALSVARSDAAESEPRSNLPSPPVIAPENKPASNAASRPVVVPERESNSRMTGLAEDEDGRGDEGNTCTARTDADSDVIDIEVAPVMSTKRGRGRPKHNSASRKRGRPRKADADGGGAKKQRRTSLRKKGLH